MSEPISAPETNDPAETAATPFSATGASFTGVIVTVMVPMFESTVPSFALNVKASVPDTLPFGM